MALRDILFAMASRSLFHWRPFFLLRDSMESICSTKTAFRIIRRVVGGSTADKLWQRSHGVRKREGEREKRGLMRVHCWCSKEIRIGIKICDSEETNGAGVGLGKRWLSQTVLSAISNGHENLQSARAACGRRKIEAQPSREKSALVPANTRSRASIKSRPLCYRRAHPLLILLQSTATICLLVSPWRGRVEDGLRCPKEILNPRPETSSCQSIWHPQPRHPLYYLLSNISRILIYSSPPPTHTRNSSH